MEEKKSNIILIIFLIIALIIISIITINLYLENTTLKNTTAQEEANVTIENDTFKYNLYTWKDYSFESLKDIFQSDYDENIHGRHAYIYYIFETLEDDYISCNFFDLYDKYATALNPWIGDRTAIPLSESNYDQYNPISKNNTLEKYTEKITTRVFYSSEYVDAFVPDIPQLEDNSIDSTIKRASTLLEKGLLTGADEKAIKNCYSELTQLTIINGNTTSEEDFRNNARAKNIVVTVNDDKTFEFTLDDTNKLQTFDLYYKQDNIKTPIKIDVEVLDSYPGKESQDIYISDIQYGFSSNLPQGR